MAKKRREADHLSRSSAATPYSRMGQRQVVKNTVDDDRQKNVKEWEEAVCPVCMEHPHSAVLLRCSNRNLGCRPYVCNTGARHSDCVKKLYETSIPVSTSTDGHGPGHKLARGSTIMCPFCRGHVRGWDMIDPAAREYMNSKSRNCSSDTCDFSGTYAELRKHVRSEHPLSIPREVDPSRQQMWLRLEQEREMLDLEEYGGIQLDQIALRRIPNMLPSLLVELPGHTAVPRPGLRTYLVADIVRRINSRATHGSSFQGEMQGLIENATGAEMQGQGGNSSSTTPASTSTST